LNANNTFYTVPYEEEYSGNGESVAVYYFDEYPTSTSVTVNSLFKSHVQINGRGRMVNSVSHNNKMYSYLAYAEPSQGSGYVWCIDTIARTASGSAITNQSTAKWGTVAKSALDKPSSIYASSGFIVESKIYSLWNERSVDALSLGERVGVRDCSHSI
jgi:hypothetical protein